MVRLKTVFIAAFLSLLLNNCASNSVEKLPTDNLADNTKTAGENPENQLDFYDSEIFDGKLSVALLADQPKVEVMAVSPFSANDIPKRLGAWLMAVNEYGGTVKMLPDPAYPPSKSRGFISEIIDLVVLGYEAVKKGVMYEASEKYNLTMYYKPDGVVTKIVFYHK